MNLQYQFYKIERGSEWWAKAQKECQRFRDWLKLMRKVSKEMSALAGVKHDSFAYAETGWRGKDNCQLTSLKCELTGTPNSHGLKKGFTDGVWEWRANSLGRKLEKLANSTRVVPFLEFLPESEGFPFNHEFKMTSRGMIHYEPKAFHSVKGPKRTVVQLGCDLETDLTVPGLPDGVVQVTVDDANVWLHGAKKRKLQKA